MEKTHDIEILKKGNKEDLNLLNPEEMENVEGGDIQCNKGYSSNILGTDCECGYKNTDDEEEAP